MIVKDIFSWNFHIGYKCFISANDAYISSNLKEIDYKKVLESILQTGCDFSKSKDKRIAKKYIYYKVTDKNTLKQDRKAAFFVKMNDVCIFVNDKTVLKKCNVYKSITYNDLSDTFNEFAVVERLDGSKNFINLKTKKELNDKKYKECINAAGACMHNALCARRMDDSLTWVNTETGEELNDERYIDMGKAYRDAIFVKKESGWNILLDYGFEFLKKDYVEIKPLSKGVFTCACKCDDELWTFCNEYGNEVFDKYGEILKTYSWNVSKKNALNYKSIYAAVTNDDKKSILLLDYKGNRVAIVGSIDNDILCDCINITNMDGKKYSLWADGTVTEGFTYYENRDKHTIKETFKPQYDKIENRFPEKYAKLY